MVILLRLVAQGVRDLFSNAWAQALTLAAVTLVSFLGGLFLLVLHNLDRQLVVNQSQVQFQVFWKGETSPDVLRQQWAVIQDFPRVDLVRTFTPEQGLDVLEESLGQGANLDWLRQDNPLQPVALVQFALPREDEAFARDMLGRLQALPGVEAVHYNPLQVDLARSWIAFSRRIVWPLIGFMTLVLALVVGNTLKLSLMHRGDEIELLRLVGATRWYIRFPLVVGGVVQSLVGGLLAMGMLKIVQVGLRDLLNVPPLSLRIEFLAPAEVLTVLAALVLVGMASSWMALRR